MNNPLKYTDPDGEFVLFAVGAVIGAYIGGVATNKGELNPFRWDYKSPMTYLGMGFGAIFGGYGGYAIANPGSFAFAGSLSSPWVTGGVSVTSLGMGTDWRYNFHWSTAAGGGGEYGKINDPANIADKAISNAQKSSSSFWPQVEVGQVRTGVGHTLHKTEEYKFFYRLRKHYEVGKGVDFEITENEFQYLIKKGDIDYDKAKDIGNGYYSTIIDFYNSNNDLKYSFGRATITYKITTDRLKFA